MAENKARIIKRTLSVQSIRIIREERSALDFPEGNPMIRIPDLIDLPNSGNRRFAEAKRFGLQ